MHFDCTLPFSKSHLLIVPTTGILSLGLHYTEEQGGDRTVEITDAAENLSDNGLNNALSRYKIEGNEVWGFYRGANFEDLIFTATGPLDWTRVDAQFNDQVSSVKVISK